MPAPLILPETPSFRLDGRRALVTGAGRGIGLAAAAALAGSGAAVTLAARSAGEIEAVAEAIQAAGGEAATLVLDIGDVEATRRAIASRPAFHALINNAGTNRPVSFAEVTPEDFDAVMGLNLRGAFFAAQAVARRMREEGVRGSIINVSSQMGHVGGPNRSVYCASKWAMEGWTRAMALDLAPHGIRANTLCPTFIETPLTRPFFEKPEFRDWVLSKIKLGRLGQVQDLMGPVVFLASDASALMTGASLLVDGGWTAE
ncbi:SDR family NAD(P)-dependent oxidoreductase [Siccirubricoccus sp. G192]|uniref:SDR family NAD(P)-dependent oxidoreductase n=1 Tax=Siccirubricoccus sp. G192 TaxID=2849651 RepID=UPI001C2BC552|nr:SDR family oxidoreductase [Siccirubricoccus sp. G192]MBV1798481.1 SDR family oxidoreductase [Siccirubricoccus sp. G192]